MLTDLKTYCYDFPKALYRFNAISIKLPDPTVSCCPMKLWWGQREVVPGHLYGNKEGAKKEKREDVRSKESKCKSFLLLEFGVNHNNCNELSSL